MKPVIKSYHSLEMFVVDDEYKPEDLENFGFTFELQIGPENTRIEEVFSFFVCSPKWFLEHSAKADITLGRHYLFMGEYNFQKLINWLSLFVDSCTGDTWEEVVEKLSRLGRWEYEIPLELE